MVKIMIAKQFYLKTAFLLCFFNAYSGTASANVTNVASDNLVGAWSFNEGSGRKILDSTKNNNGRLRKGLKWSEGKIEGALSFNGKNRTRLKVDAPDNMSQFTACTWINPHSLSNNDNDKLIYILEKNYSLRFNNQGRLSFTIPTTSSYPSVKSSTNLVTNSWQHVCAVYHGVDTAPEIYIDGQNKSIDGKAGNGKQKNDKRQSLFVGGDKNRWGGNFEGKLDEVQIYNRTLSASEINTLYNPETEDTETEPENNAETTEQASLSYPLGAVEHWNFNEEAGKVASNNAGSVNVKLMKGTTWTNGKLAGALLFNGKDYTRLKADAPDNMSAFTACTWVNPHSLTNEDNDKSIYILEKNYSLRFNNQGKLSFTIPSTSSYPSVKSSANLTTNSWQHVCAVYHGVSTAPEIYINGQNKSIDGKAGNGKQANDSRRTLFLGGNSNRWSGNLDGKLDDVIIYSQALPASDIWTLYGIGEPLAGQQCKDCSSTTNDETTLLTKINKTESNPTPDPVTTVIIAPSVDSDAPSTPQNFTTTAVSSTQVTLSWETSTDNIDVTGYKIYRDNVEIAVITDDFYVDTQLSPDTAYAYTVSAYDQAANHSTQSSELTVQTLIPQLAFPGAEGFGAYSIGGRGGRIVRVTNLNDNGPGSFREAVQASSRNYPDGVGTSWKYEPYDKYLARLNKEGHRIIVFDVSGIINLESSLSISYPYLTIAGQTSPGGILIAGRKTTVKTHDVIMQHMRFRVGSHRINGDSKIAESLDAFAIWGNAGDSNAQDAYNIIVDHCSFSWGVDETFETSYNPKKITVQNSIISEGLSHAGHPKGEHSKGMLIWGKYSPDLTMSIHHNYFAHNYARNPLINAGNEDRPLVDVVNNVVYDWFGGAVMASGGYVKVNWTHNYAQKGERSNSDAYEITHSSNGLSPLPTTFVTGNLGVYRQDQSYNDWSVAIGWQFVLQSEEWKRTTPWPAPSITTKEASYNNAIEILQDVGATRPFRDSVDIRVLSDFSAQTGSIIDDIRFPEDYPVFQDLPIAIDMDNDGMADSWEMTTFGDLFQTSHSDQDNDGYTNLEEYLHYLGKTLP